MTATLQMAESAAYTLPSVAQVLRRIWPRHTRKHVAIAANVPMGTARDWVEGNTCPRADKVLEMARYARVRAEFKRVLEEIDRAEQRLQEMDRQSAFAFGDPPGRADPVAQPARRSAAPARVATRRVAP